MVGYDPVDERLVLHLAEGDTWARTIEAAPDPPDGGPTGALDGGPDADAGTTTAGSDGGVVDGTDGGCGCGAVGSASVRGSNFILVFLGAVLFARRRVVG